MLRSRVISGRSTNGRGDPSTTEGKLKYAKRSSISFPTLLVSSLAFFVLGMVVQRSYHALTERGDDQSTLLSKKEVLSVRGSSPMFSQSDDPIPPAMEDMIRRAQTQRRHCETLSLTQESSLNGLNGHDAHLPAFGFLKYFETKYSQEYKQSIEEYQYTCVLPPEEECAETQFTVIFMAYNPDRLKKMYNQIVNMLQNFSGLVKEVIIVWNGDRAVEETQMGQTLVDLTKTHSVRISYPLKAGFPNDLFNRYHPRLEVTTKAIMYYDDDGPFYSYKATLGGFELWKRNANAQIGAMARKLDFDKRQEEERNGILNGPGDRFFVSHCPVDEIRYNYNEFAQFGAKMVLPSGSFLHSNYLSCLWHPIFEEIRKYIQKHPVNPDDGTVSAIVAQLSGRAPKVYSRRINESGNNKRRLTEHMVGSKDNNESYFSEGTYPPINATHISRRRLMDGINWDAGGDHSKKMDWGKLRSDAANSLSRYFGSVNSGSIGWCYGTAFQKKEYCEPDQAKVGMIPWMNPDHTAKTTCP